MIIPIIPPLRAVWRALIPPELTLDPDAFRQANRVVAFHLAMLFWVPVFSAIYCLLGSPLCAAIVGGAGIALMVNLWLFRHTRSVTLCGNVMCTTAWCTYTGLAMVTGGPDAPVMVWYASIPVLSLLLCGSRWGIGWTLVTEVTIGALALARAYGWQFSVDITPSGMRVLQFAGLGGLVFCVYILARVLNSVEFTARQALHEANGQLKRQASIDGLTGIANRRSFDRTLEQEWKRAERKQLPLTVALIDADLFKQYNDVFGHLKGDECLQAIARVIQGGIHRAGDLAARYGGEEFALILPNTTAEAALGMAENIRAQVKSLEIPSPNSSVCSFVTISIGTATAIPQRGESPWELLHEADVALYRAKTNGRDQTMQSDAVGVGSEFEAFSM